MDQDFAGGDVRLSVTWFDSELENEIFTDYPAPTFVATPANRDTESSRKGLELSASARLGETFTLDAAYTWLDDPSFIPVRVTLEEYTLVNLAATYRLSERFELFGRVENLLDERYQQVFSFVSPGRSAVLGLRASF